MVGHTGRAADERGGRAGDTLYDPCYPCLIPRAPASCAHSTPHSPTQPRSTSLGRIPSVTQRSIAGRDTPPDHSSSSLMSPPSRRLPLRSRSSPARREAPLPRPRRGPPRPRRKCRRNRHRCHRPSNRRSSRLNPGLKPLLRRRLRRLRAPPSLPQRCASASPTVPKSSLETGRAFGQCAAPLRQRALPNHFAAARSQRCDRQPLSALRAPSEFPLPQGGGSSPSSGSSDSSSIL